MNCLVIDSPIGRLTLCANADDTALTHIRFGEKLSAGDILCTTPLLRRAAEQLGEYFAGQRKEFDLPLDPAGTPFQQSCRRALCAIPYGETRSYGQQAVAVGNPKACRAVGMANNRNPLPVVIPCHRVVGSGGKLVGYAGGLNIKEKLLALEAQNSRPHRAAEEE